MSKRKSEEENPKFNSEEDIKQASLYECDKRQLEALFRKSYMPDSYKYDASEMQTGRAVPKKKPYRTAFPSEEIQQEMLVVEQNSKPWMDFRSGSAGGSGLAALLGWDAGFLNNVYLFFLESGRACKQHSKSVLDLFFMKNGHYNEDLIGKIYSCVMGCQCYIVGMILHWMVCFLHISPDLLCYFGKAVFHNLCNVRDSRRGNVEIKAPIFAAYKTHGGMNLVPTYYLIQCMMQMHTFLTSWNDFVAMWMVNEKMGPISATATHGEGVWLVGETLITRIYRSNAFCDKVLLYLRQFLAHLSKTDFIFDFVNDSNFVYKARAPKDNEQVWIYLRLDKSEEASANIQLPVSEFEFDAKTGNLRILFDTLQYQFPGDGNSINNLKWSRVTHHQVVVVYPPKLLEKVALPTVTILPLKRVCFYLYCEKGKSPYNKETNSLEGEIKAEITDFWNQKPIIVSMQELFAHEDYTRFADQVPEAEPLPKSFQIVNPLWKEKKKKEPQKPIDDIIFEYSTASQNLLLF
jgi:hypothetical protein